MPRIIEVTVTGKFKLPIYWNLEGSGFYFLNDGGVEQRGDVTQISRIPFGHFSQNPAHDFTRPGFWQATDELNFIGFGDGSDYFGNRLPDFRFQLFFLDRLLIANDKSINALSFHIVRVADHGRFTNGR